MRPLSLSLPPPASFPLLLLFLTAIIISTHTTTTTTHALQTVSNTPVVICPGFGNDQIDYYEPLQQPRDVGLVACLERRGFDPDLISTIPVQRRDWFRVAGGLFDVNFYTNKALPTGNGYGWYLKRFQETIEEAYVKSGGERVLVIGHSAGGWLARAGMQDGYLAGTTNDSNSNNSYSKKTRTADRICGLVTVGAIHKPPISVASCVTRGALAYTDAQYPGAYLKDQGVGYVSVGGDAIVGDNSKVEAATAAAAAETEADKAYVTRGEGSAAKVAFNSYEAVCGRGDVTGDGVVPLEWTQLEGAKQLRLKGVLHSINEAGTTIPTDRWYGSEKVIDQWLPEALKEAGISTTTTSATTFGKSSGFDFGSLQKWASEVFQQS